MLDILSSFNIAQTLFFIIVGVYLWYTFSTVYHLIRFGVGKNPKILALVFFAGSFVLFSIVLSFYSKVDLKAILQQLFKNIIPF